MSGAGSVAALERELGADALERHATLEVDDLEISATLRPTDGEALSRSVAALGRLGLAGIVRGAGRHLAIGNPPERADVFLATDRLGEVDAFEASEGVCHAGSGARIADLRAVVEAEGWELPIDATDDTSLGGALAAAVLGPRSHGFGAPRDAVLGLEVVLGTGERARCGGRVVKNVTGYDLAKLYVGSLGTLAVIEGAWLRLRPRPETTKLLAATARDLDQGCTLAHRASRCATARAVALWGRAEGGYECVVELAGDAAGVAHEAVGLPLEEAPAERLSRVAQVQTAEGSDDLIVRLAALPTRLAGIARGLAEAGAEIAVHPGLCLAYGRFACVDAEEQERALGASEAIARRGEAGLRIERASAESKRGRDVFAASPAEVRLTRALKARFDPQGSLAPGRAAGPT
jgi:glycolate oxidase FAD binding subunit